MHDVVYNRKRGRMAVTQAEPPRLGRSDEMFVVECGECGLRLDPGGSIPEDACPRCRAHAWQRSEPPYAPAEEPV